MRTRGALPLLGLMLLSIVVQSVCYLRCATPAGDAVKVVHTAQRIDSLGWAAACESMDQQPLYPGWVWCVHAALKTLLGERSDLWATAVQLAASIPLVLAVAPFTWLNIRWHGRRVGYAAGAFLAVLPAAARLGPSGLGDALHLLAFVIACGLFQRLLEREPRPSPAIALACGAAIGAAFLVRVEGLLLVGALALVWAIRDVRETGSLRLRERLPATLAIAAGALVVLGPFSLATGRWVQKYSLASGVENTASSPSADGAAPAQEAASTTNPIEAALASTEPPVWRRADGSTLALPFKDERGSGRRFGLTLPIEHFCGELAEALAYL
ncbi:MAG TPA: glycosyltransferase family 39 protein, partial [Pirellulales bacterium]